uniref:Ubiquitin specific peptidase 39 n=1 Tax=Rousettus aegyptiacus TaxID=9407 RepID=A0A7J8FNJ2_ROUAE|nr:ubiquitin specific peptidase 39 [Rousettus aegyptiacus]
MSGRSKRESRASTRGKRESESRVNSARVKRERDRERETEAPSSRGSPVRVKREVEPASAREAAVSFLPAVRVKREREADEDSEPEREQRMVVWIPRTGGVGTAHTWIPLTGVCWTLTLRNCVPSPFPTSMHMPVWCAASTFRAGV